MKRHRSSAQQPSSSIDENELIFRKNQFDYYNRLVYQCRKDLNKHIKVTKKFEVQKQIRKVKDVSSQKNDGKQIVAKQEIKLRQLKDYVTEPIIDECFRRLGIKQLDPKLQFCSTTDEKGDPFESNRLFRRDDLVASSSSDLPSNLDFHCEEDSMVGLDASLNVQISDLDFVSSHKIIDTDWIVDRIMKHKTMISALEHWNNEVTEYRRWCLRQQERIDGEDSEFNERNHKKGKKTTKNSYTDASMKGSSLFVSMGSTAADVNAPENLNSDPFSYYGPGGGDEITIKKNRQGQRARRAKVAAIEAKKHGRTLRPEESLNWRTPKVQPEQVRDANWKDRQSIPVLHRSTAPNIKSDTTIPVEELHPSWQARKGQKESIVAFQGKKITFDD